MKFSNSFYSFAIRNKSCKSQHLLSVTMDKAEISKYFYMQQADRQMFHAILEQTTAKLTNGAKPTEKIEACLMQTIICLKIKNSVWFKTMEFYNLTLYTPPPSFVLPVFLCLFWQTIGKSLEPVRTSNLGFQGSECSLYQEIFLLATMDCNDVALHHT